MNKGDMIGKGMSAEVYEWGDQQVLKLYYDNYQPEWVRFEAEISAAVKEAGVPAPSVYEMLEEGGRHGLLYERIPGVSMLAMIQSSPYRILRYAREMAWLHWSIHRCSTTKLPRQKDRLEQAINDSKELLGEKTKLICEFMDTLPTGNWVCHGDFHPDNILMTNHQSIAIDWTNASIGDPMCDVARTSLMLLSPFNPPGTPRTMEPLLCLFKRTLNRAYLNEYCRSSNIKADSMNSWILPVAAARLQEGIPGEQEWLLHLINHRLQNM
ncbi:aminoglycoside phosphotransferase [Paenibacillus terrae]|uniref:Aminoglycoside phosphotransferase n=1 Tax=Paenibacillus terrae TaxID=159743 RepID=A0A4U2Q2R4_9BACL|nr:aminoglycoside phosphotransferase family protein [Paenibacillus terrae]TKH43854.1 aminoglycoside phosphotransferase [Paenibacillus terrae]